MVLLRLRRGPGLHFRTWMKGRRTTWPAGQGASSLELKRCSRHALCLEVANACRVHIDCSICCGPKLHHASSETATGLLWTVGSSKLSKCHHPHGYYQATGPTVWPFRCDRGRPTLPRPYFVPIKSRLAGGSRPEPSLPAKRSLGVRKSEPIVVTSRWERTDSCRSPMRCWSHHGQTLQAAGCLGVRRGRRSREGVTARPLTTAPRVSETVQAWLLAAEFDMQELFSSKLAPGERPRPLTHMLLEPS